MDDQKERTPRSKKTTNLNGPQQLHTHNVPVNDVENTNSTGGREVYYSLISSGVFPEEKKLSGKSKRIKNSPRHLPKRRDFTISICYLITL